LVEGAGFSALVAGAGEESTDAAGDGAAVEETLAEALAETLAAALAEASGEETLAALAEAWGEADGIGEVVAVGVALPTSLSSTPTRRPALCLAVSTVNNKVTAKKMQPR
jgi:hypothetical protein